MGWKEMYFIPCQPSSYPLALKAKHGRPERFVSCGDSQKI